MKITAVMTVVVAFASAGPAAQRRIRSGEEEETFRGSVELIGKDNTPVGALVFEQRGADGAVSISGSLYGLPHRDYLGIAHDSSNYDGTCYSAGPPISVEDLEYGEEDELYVFDPTETRGENNTLVKTSHSISLSPGDTYIGGRLILIHSLSSFERWETDDSPTTYFSPDSACGFFMMDSPNNGKVPNVNTPDDLPNSQKTSEETDTMIAKMRRPLESRSISLPSKIAETRRRLEKRWINLPSMIAETRRRLEYQWISLQSKIAETRRRLENRWISLPSKIAEMRRRLENRWISLPSMIAKM